LREAQEEKWKFAEANEYGEPNKERMQGAATPAGALQRRLWNSPAVTNDCPKLELPGAWQPSDSSIPLPDGEGQGAFFGFSYGNQSD